MTEKPKTGYKQPPNDHQFKPGRSGNPRGRPKGSRNLRTDLAEMMTKPIAIRENGKVKRISRQEAMLLGLYEKAVHGDVKAAKNIMDMIVKLNLASSSDKAVEISDEIDKTIIADFLRRHQN